MFLYPVLICASMVLFALIMRQLFVWKIRKIEKQLQELRKFNWSEFLK
jgi:hypothetical protein